MTKKLINNAVRNKVNLDEDLKRLSTSHFSRRRMIASQFEFGSPATLDTVTSAPDYQFNQPLQVKRLSRVNNNAYTESLCWVCSFLKGDAGIN